MNSHVPAIVLDHLSYAYPVYDKGQPIPVLHDLNLIIETGSFVAITGPTGAGKTTLCLALAGLIPLSVGGVFDGAVRLFDRDTTTSSPADISCTLGSVFQDPESQLFSMTVAEEIAFPLENRGLCRKEIKNRIAHALAAVNLSGFESRQPQSLSGGQMQRVSIAAMIASQPQIMVLDEPASGLDPVGKEEVYLAIRHLKEKQQCTILLVEQDSECIGTFADRLVVLHNGNIAADDTPRTIYRNIKRCHDLGIDVPPMAELAFQLNEREERDTYHFFTTEEALSVLGNTGGTHL